MELMSSLLLCAFVAYFPQALGQPRLAVPNLDIKYNNSKIVNQQPQHKKILLNLNGPPLVNVISDLQYVFMDVRCRKCLDCMERAIRAYKGQTEHIKRRPSYTDLHKEVLNSRYEIRSRSKRELVPVVKVKRVKGKKKIGKSVTVTKYNVDGEVYAIKVKESTSSDKNNNDTSACHIYNVKKSYVCDTPESETFLTNARRKVNKKIKKDKDKQKAVTISTEKPHFVAPSFRKRQVDHADIPENFEFSIEEMY